LHVLSIALLRKQAGGGITAGIINTLRRVISGLRREVDDNLGYPETSVRSYHYSLRNIPEERSVQIIYSWSV